MPNIQTQLNNVMSSCQGIELALLKYCFEDMNINYFVADNTSIFEISYNVILDYN